MPQKSESCFIKWLGENICKVVLGWNIAQLNFSTVDVITNEMMTNLDVLRS